MEDASPGGVSVGIRCILPLGVLVSMTHHATRYLSVQIAAVEIEANVFVEPSESRLGERMVFLGQVYFLTRIFFIYHTVI